MGDALERNGIQLKEALTGTVVTNPEPFHSDATRPHPAGPVKAVGAGAGPQK
jgi:hypothetical protein